LEFRAAFEMLVFCYGSGASIFFEQGGYFAAAAGEFGDIG